MKNSKALYHELTNRIKLEESSGEIKEVVLRLMEKYYGLSHADILAGKGITMSPMTERLIDASIERINRHEPVQYVIKEADFYGRKYFVDESVLIPRPETEELVRLAINESRKLSNAAISILDVGTGSGCIAITLSLELPFAVIIATDVSEAALIIATRNQYKLRSKVRFVPHDILNDPISFGTLDMIVSNPPYIAMSEKAAMDVSVHHYEPGLALFVPDNDPLLFYRSLVIKSIQSLQPSGILMVEINERFGNEVASLFEAEGFQRIRIVKDIFRKDRIVVGYKKT